jgi:hypothetical protein
VGASALRFPLRCGCLAENSGLEEVGRDVEVRVDVAATDERGGWVQEPVGAQSIAETMVGEWLDRYSLLGHNGA